MTDATATLRRGPALAGLAIAVGAVLALATRVEVRAGPLDPVPFLVPALALAGALVGLAALGRASLRLGAVGSGLVLAAAVPLRQGLPSLVDWGLALAAAVGLLLFLESLHVAHRTAQLGDRLGADPEAEAVDPRVEHMADRRASRLRRTLLLGAGVVGGSVVLTRVLRFVLPPRLGASLELASLYGAATVTGTVLVVAGAVAGVRRWRSTGGTSAADETPDA